MDVQMPVNGSVDVSVYDILGQRIATLLSGEQSAGYHTVEWNGMNNAGLSVPSGIYFVRMNSVGFSVVQKIMLMK
jgi:flagellar hook assembly protein FlgD